MQIKLNIKEKERNKDQAKILFFPTCLFCGFFFNHQMFGEEKQLLLHWFASFATPGIILLPINCIF